MKTFFVALGAVAVLLAVAVPGYILKKKKMVSDDCMPALSKILLFVCQPCLAIYSFSGIPFSAEMLINIGIFALLMILIHAVMLGGAYLVLKKKAVMPIYRILTIGTTFGNCAFFGIPIIEALLPAEAAGLIVYTTVYAVVMNVLGWTVGSAIIAQDIKYMSIKKTFVNPAMIGVGVALLIYITGIDFPSELDSMISSAARMATPLSMIVMGMRLATMDIKSMFTDIRIYLTVAVKQLLMPLIAFGTVMLLLVTTSVDVSLLRVFFITCSCPAASIVLNFAEIVGEGQKNAANLVLISTLLSIVTLPIMMLLLPLIA
jgi:predicted permease